MEENNQTEDLVVKKKGSQNKRTVIIATVAFLLVVAAMFAFAFFKQSQMEDDSATNQDDNSEVDGRYGYIERIDGKHFYIDGVHTVVGEVEMPTPCDLLEGEAIVAESYPEQITLDLQVTNNAEFCAEVITPQRFKISATASEEATFNALFNNRVVELNLIEASPDETPEDFELFIKG